MAILYYQHKYDANWIGNERKRVSGVLHVQMIEESHTGVAIKQNTRGLDK